MEEKSAQEVALQFKVDIDAGLSSREAAERLAVNGNNELKEEKEKDGC